MKCGKVKNPCKICFQSVSNKSGLQCKGACKKWAHYKCLNFTPGKISDVKAGIIKITCPCPDCTTSEPKEVLTNAPYTCTNQECPATKLPSCESTDCPSKQKPIPQFQPIQTPLRPISPELSHLQPCAPPKSSPPCTPPRKVSPPRKCPTPPRKCPTPPRKASPPRRPVSPPKRPVSPPRRTVSPPQSASPLRQKNASRPICPSCPMHCPKKSPQQTVADRPCSPQRSHSCSFISGKSSDSGKTHCEVPRSCSSDSGLSNAQQDQKMIFCTIEQMCNTVGQLSNQLKDLMCKMMAAFERSNIN